MLGLLLSFSAVIVVMAQFPQHQSELLDLSVIIGDAVKMASLVQLYEEYISEEWYEPWDSFIWIAGEL